MRELQPNHVDYRIKRRVHSSPIICILMGPCKFMFILLDLDAEAASESVSKRAVLRLGDADPSSTELITVDRSAVNAFDVFGSVKSVNISVIVGQILWFQNPD